MWPGCRVYTATSTIPGRRTSQEAPECPLPSHSQMTVSNQHISCLLQVWWETPYWGTNKLAYSFLSSLSLLPQLPPSLFLPLRKSLSMSWHYGYINHFHSIHNHTWSEFVLFLHKEAGWEAKWRTRSCAPYFNSLEKLFQCHVLVASYVPFGPQSIADRWTE